MENPQDQSAPAPAENHIIAVEPGLDLPMEVQVILQRYDPKLSFELRVLCAKLEYANRHLSGRPRSLLAQAAAEHRSERQYAESNGGWRHGVNRLAEKAARS